VTANSLMSADRATVVLFLALACISEIGAAADTSADSGSPALTEILVTAQKREERLQDVPVPVTSLSAEQLEDSNKLRLQDYFTSIPGVNITPSAFGQPTIIIRGITTAIGTLTAPTVGVTVDDVPYGSTTALGGGALVPDIDPSELARVEVLRGPQGTFYGSTSLGGLLKYVTADPSTEAFSGRVQTDVSSVYGGAGPGYGVRGSVNIPLSDTLAVRISASDRRDPAYVENLNTGTREGEEDDYGGRVAVLWRPLDDFSLKLSALVQDSKRYGSSEVNTGPDAGDLQQNVIPGIGGFDRNYQVYSANLKWKIGGVDLTSITGYSANRFVDSVDETAALGNYFAPTFGPAFTGDALTEKNTTSKFSQEFRASSSIGKYFDWFVGLFYTHEDSPYQQQYIGEDPSTGVQQTAIQYSWHDVYDEYAAFTDLTVHFTDQFNIQFGGRESHYKQTFTEVDTGPYVSDPGFDDEPSPLNYGATSEHENSFTYLVTPQFKISEDLMVYARIASGYRPGGPQDLPLVYHEPSKTFKADTTTNYEVGFKGDVLNHAVSFDASIYYIDWKNIQITVLDPATELTVFTNGPSAKSEGVELSGQWKPIEGLTVGSWVAWNEAELTEAFPANSFVYAPAGARLPYSGRWSGNISIDEEFPIAGGVAGFVGGEASFVDDREGPFRGGNPATNPRFLAPQYTDTDLRAGAKYDRWTASVFANNITDRRGVLAPASQLTNTHSFIITPRTIGLSISRTF
jgi:iron complex outermembrane recepter protein